MFMILHKHTRILFARAAAIAVSASISPHILLLVSLALAAGASVSLAIQRWGFALLLLVLMAITRETAVFQFARATKQKPFFCRMTAVYAEWLVVLGLAVTFSLPAFLAFALALLAEHARAARQRIAQHVFSFSSFGERADRMGTIIISLLIVYIAGVWDALNGFTALHAPLLFGIALPAWGLYAAAALAFIAFARSFFTALWLAEQGTITEHRILVAIPVALAAAYFISREYYALALVFSASAFFIRAWYGTTAKNKGMPSGNYFCTIVGMVAEAIIFLGFIPVFPFAGMLAFSLGGIASHAALAGKAMKADNSLQGMGEHGRALVLLAGMALSALVPRTGLFFTMELVLYALAAQALIENVLRLRFPRSGA